MAKKELKETKKKLVKISKKEISKKIEDALSDIKVNFGEKKFKRRLKKASALFTNGAKPQKVRDASSEKKNKPKEKAAQVKGEEQLA